MCLDAGTESKVVGEQLGSRAKERRDGDREIYQGYVTLTASLPPVMMQSFRHEKSPDHEWLLRNNT